MLSIFLFQPKGESQCLTDSMIGLFYVPASRSLISVFAGCARFCMICADGYWKTCLRKWTSNHDDPHRETQDCANGFLLVLDNLPRLYALEALSDASKSLDKPSRCSSYRGCSSGVGLRFRFVDKQFKEKGQTLLTVTSQTKKAHSTRPKSGKAGFGHSIEEIKV